MLLFRLGENYSMKLCLCPALIAGFIILFFEVTEASKPMLVYQATKGDQKITLMASAPSGVPFTKMPICFQNRVTEEKEVQIEESGQPGEIKNPLHSRGFLDFSDPKTKSECLLKKLPNGSMEPGPVSKLSEAEKQSLRQILQVLKNRKLVFGLTDDKQFNQLNAACLSGLVGAYNVNYHVDMEAELVTHAKEEGENIKITQYGDPAADAAINKENSKTEVQVMSLKRALERVRLYGSANWPYERGFETDNLEMINSECTKYNSAGLAKAYEERNKAWLKKIIKFENGNSKLVSVGVCQLDAGPGGITKLLAKEGFTVRRMNRDCTVAGAEIKQMVPGQL